MPGENENGEKGLVGPAKAAVRMPVEDKQRVRRPKRRARIIERVSSRLVGRGLSPEDARVRAEQAAQRRLAKSRRARALARRAAIQRAQRPTIAPPLRQPAGFSPFGGNTPFGTLGANVTPGVPQNRAAGPGGTRVFGAGVDPVRFL